MTKLLLFSDLHLRPESEETCFKVLEGVIETALELNIKYIAFLGDFWHLRYQVPVHLLNKVDDWVDRLIYDNKLDLRILPGNHDQVDENGQHALEIFKKKALVFTDPYQDQFGTWMPYRKNKDEVAKCLGQASTPILFCHLPILGAMMNNLMEDKDGLSVEHFKKFDRVICGHYHKRQSFLNDKVTYIGSPWQTRADEYGQEKGFAIWDTETRKLTFIDKVYGKRYWKFNYSEPKILKSQIEAFHPDPGDVISLLTKDKSELDAGLKILHKAGYDHIIGSVATTDIPQPRYGFSKATPLTEYAKSYATSHGLDVADIDHLMKVWEELL